MVKQVLAILSFAFSALAAKPIVYCGPAPELASYNQVLTQMHKDPYPAGKLPIQPITLFRKMVSKMLPEFFVGRRSTEILQEKRDYREVGEVKPIHPMGVGFEGTLDLQPSRWSGAFRGGKFPVLVRASISQGNPFKKQPQSNLAKLFGKQEKDQPRSTAFAIKIFNSPDLDLEQKTANIVFQNDLNGEVNSNGTAVNWTETIQTNHPKLNVLKIRKLYEVVTLIGVVQGALATPQDKGTKFPYINPGIRPVHSMAELGEADPGKINTPVWVMLRPSKDMEVVLKEDFREELVETAKKNGALIYEMFAADALDQYGQKKWERVGVLRLNRAILSKGVDENILFPHDSIRSLLTGKEMQIPTKPAIIEIPFLD